MDPLSYRSKLSTLTILASAPIIVLLLFAGVVAYLHQSGSFPRHEDPTSLFMWIVPATLALSFVLSEVVFKTSIKKISPDTPLKEKFNKYQNAIILRMAVIEIPGLLGCVAALVTGSLYFLTAPLAVAVILYVSRPSVFRMTADLALNREEQRMLAEE